MSKIVRQFGEITLSMAISSIMALAAAAYVFIRSWCSADPLLFMLALIGALIGWVVAILATPLSKEEGASFGELAKIISGFVSGYLLSKVDPLVNGLLMAPDQGSALIADPLIAERTLTTLISFFIALLFVFGGRLYWSPKPAAQFDTRTKPVHQAAGTGG